MKNKLPKYQGGGGQVAKNLIKKELGEFLIKRGAQNVGDVKNIMTTLENINYTPSVLKPLVSLNAQSNNFKNFLSQYNVNPDGVTGGLIHGRQPSEAFVNSMAELNPELLLQFSPQNADKGMFDLFAQNWVQDYNKGYRGGFGFYKDAPESYFGHRPPRRAATASTPQDMLTQSSGMIGDFAGKSIGLGKYQTDNLNNAIGYATQYPDWSDSNRWRKVGIIQNFPGLGQRGQTMGDILKATNTNETLGQYFQQNTGRWSMPQLGMQTRGVGLSERVVRPETAMQSKILDIRDGLKGGGISGMKYNPITKKYELPGYNVDYGGVGNVYTPNTRSDNPYTLAEPSTRGVDAIMKRLLLNNKKYGGQPLPKAQFGKELAKIFNRTNKSSIGKTPLNWGKVNESILDNKILLQEYKLIEEATKANGTWMKNADGSAFTGPPELFIQTKSSNFLDAYPDGYQTVWRGMEKPSSTLLNNVNLSVVDGDSSKMIKGTGVFTGNQRLAQNYRPYDHSPLYQLAMRNSNNSIEIPGLGSDWLDITNPYMKKKKSLMRELQLNRKGLEKAKASDNMQFIQSARTAEWQDDYFKSLERKNKELENVIINYDFIKTDPKYSELAKWWNDANTRVGGIYSDSALGTKKMFNNVNKLLGKTPRGVSTDDLGIYLQQVGLDNIRIPNIIDGGRGDVFINNQVPGNYLKSLTENDGMFDLTKPSQFEKDGGELIKHTIVRGDTGKTLFEKYGVTASDIKEHNNIKFFAEGREIEIPSRELPKAQDGTETQSFRELHDESGNVIMSRKELENWRSPGGYTYKQLADYNNNIAKYTPREGINLQDKTTWEGKHYGSPFNSSNYDLFSNNEWNPQSQSDAYRMNRDMGNSSFFYQGKPYTTESKEELENRTPSQKLLDFNNNIAQIAQDKGLYGESLQNYINEMFPEGSRERNLLDMYEADSGKGFYTSYIEDNKDDMYMRSLYRDLENATSDGPEASNTLLEQEAIMNEIEARKKKMSQKAADVYQGPDIGDINIDQGEIRQDYAGIPYNAQFLYDSAPGLAGNPAAQRRFATENPASPTNALAIAGMAAPILGGVGALSSIPLGGGFVAGDLINAGFGYNALSNTLPQAATDFYDGNYLDALGNATVGGLELMGAPTTFMKGYRGLQNNVNLFPKLNTQKAVNSLVPNSKLLNDYGLSQTKNLSLNARDLPAWSFSGRPNQLQARNYFRNNFNPADNTLINALP